MTNMIEIDGIQIPESKILELGYTKTKVDKVFKPKLGEDYFYWWGDGTITETSWRDNDTNEGRMAMGNVSKTVEEAKKAVAKRQATVRVLNKLRELEGDWVADWGDDRASNYIAAYDNVDGTLNLFRYATNIAAPIELFSSKSAWDHVIENMESDVKLMMGVDNA